MGFWEEIKLIIFCCISLYESEKKIKKLCLSIENREKHIESLFQEVVDEIKQLVTQENTDSLIKRALSQYLGYRLVFKGDSALQKADNKRQIAIMHLEELLEILWKNYRNGLPIICESIISNNFSIDEYELLVSKYNLYSGKKGSSSYIREIFFRE